MRVLLAAAVAVGLAVVPAWAWPTATPPIALVGNLSFVLALPPPSGTGWRESAASACSRAGLLPASARQPLATPSGTRWNVALAQSIAAALAAAAGGASATVALGGCCANAMYCAAPAPPAPLMCEVDGVGSLAYDNVGWGVNATRLPVYACLPSSGSVSGGVPAAPVAPPLTPAQSAAIAAQASSQPLVTAVSEVAGLLGALSTRLRIDGLNFGSRVAGLNVTVGGVACDNVDVCHTMCQTCSTSADCGDDKVCLRWTSSTAYCLRPCGRGLTCPCGGACYPVSVGSGSVLNLCANANIPLLDPSAMCQWGDWRPAYNTRAASRIECNTASQGSRSGINFASTIVETTVRQLRRANLDALPPGGGGGGEGASYPRILDRHAMHEGDGAVPARGVMTGGDGDRRLQSSGATSVLELPARRFSRPGFSYGGICGNDGRGANVTTASSSGPTTSFAVVVTRDGWASTGVDRDLALALNISAYPITRPLLDPSLFVSTPPYGAALPYNGTIVAWQSSRRECTLDWECPAVDTCTVPSCSAATGCCVYLPSGACATAGPALLTTAIPAANVMLQLPREISAVLPMPPPFVGAGDYSPAAMQLRDPLTTPYAITWSAASTWYTREAFTAPGISLLSGIPGYVRSSASAVDDVPMERVALPFSLPFFGAQLAALWISPNGFLRTSANPPCARGLIPDGPPSQATSCSVAQHYVGTIMGYVWDMDPGAWAASEIAYAIFNASTVAPLGSAPTFAAADAMANSYLVMCSVWQDVGPYLVVVPRNNRPSPAFTFQICVYGDGAIRIRYGSAMGVTGVRPGEWVVNGTLDAWSGPPPDSTTWMAGVRSMSGGYLLTTQFESRAALGDIASVAADSAVWNDVNAVISRRGVRQGATVALCSHTPVACAAPACGPAAGGTIVSLAWTPPGCGLGFDPLSFVGRLVDATSLPRIECLFGDVAVPAQVAVRNATARTFTLTCTSPPLSAIASGAAAAAGANVSVPLALQLVAPSSAAAYASGGAAAVVTPAPWVNVDTSKIGWGPPASQVDTAAGIVTVPLEVYGVTAMVPGALIAPAPPTVSPSVTPSPSPSPTQIGPALRTVAIVAHALQFMYRADGGTCGCSAAIGAAGSVCDACNVCGGVGAQRDCAGQCFGTAFRDTCNACAGGATNRQPNVDVDCNGQCGGPATNCNPVPPITEASLALTIIVVGALVACCVAIFALMGYFAYVAVSRRHGDDMLWEFAVPPDPPVQPGVSAEALAAMSVVPFEPARAAGAGAGADDPTAATAEAGKGRTTDETCAICLEAYVAGDMLRILPPCTHRFHVACADNWLTRSTQCPVCRADVRPQAERDAADARRRAPHGSGSGGGGGGGGHFDHPGPLQQDGLVAADTMDDASSPAAARAGTVQQVRVGPRASAARTPRGAGDGPASEDFASPYNTAPRTTADIELVAVRPSTAGSASGGGSAPVVVPRATPRASFPVLPADDPGAELHRGLSAPVAAWSVAPGPPPPPSARGAGTVRPRDSLGASAILSAAPARIIGSGDGGAGGGGSGEYRNPLRPRPPSARLSTLAAATATAAAASTAPAAASARGAGAVV